MITVIHGVTGTDNHSAVVGAVEAENSGAVKQALRKFIQTHGKEQLNRAMFARFALENNFNIVPMAVIDYDQI